MILLRLISLPYFRKHVVRTLLTMAGIVLGVAVLVGMHTANQAVLFAFNRTVDKIAGRTELQVSAGETGFDEDVLERVQDAPSVKVAVPVIEAAVDTNLPGEGHLLVLGIDMTGDRSLRDYDLDSGDEAVIDDPLVFLAQPDSIILTREFAERNRIAVNGRLKLGTALGPREFVVRGVMKSGGLTSAFGGNLAIMDIYAAQRMFSRGRKFDRIDLASKPGHTIPECQAELRQLLGAAYQVDPPAGRGAQFQQIVAAYSTSLNFSSAFALFIGMFIIYNSFSIAVTQRRSEIGVLRALGATRGQIRWLFLVESACTGLLGSLVGIGAGLLMARGIALSIGAIVADVYGIAQRAEEVALDPRVLAGSLLLGIITSMIGGWLPARQAASVDPVKALQKGRYQVLSAGENRVRLLIAGLLALIAVICLAFSRNRGVFYLGYFSAIIAPLLLMPLLCLGVSRLLRPVLKALRPVEGSLAADSLIQAPRRTSATTAALMLSIAIVIAFGGMARGSYKSISDWADATLNPDLFVISSQSITNRTFRFPASMGDELAAIPGVGQIQRVREARVVFRQTPIVVVALEIASLARTAPRVPTEGKADEMYARAAAGTGVIVSENLSVLQKVHLGDVIDIPAPEGNLRLPVVGVVLDYSDQQGVIFLDREVFKKFWHDDSVNIFRIYVAPGASPADVRTRIIDAYAGQRQVFVLTNRELKDYILKIIDQWFALSGVQIAISVLVAILGIVNTLTVSITDRRRELGVLRAVGGLRSQIRHTIWLEAVAIAVIGLILGFGLGAINLYYSLQMVHLDISGINLAYDYPVNVALLLVPVMLLAAFIGAVWPSHQAVSGALVEALEYE